MTGEGKCLDEQYGERRPTHRGFQRGQGPADRRGARPLSLRGLPERSGVEGASSLVAAGSRGRGRLLEEPEFPVAVVLTEKAGDWIGRYKLLKNR